MDYMITARKRKERRGGRKRRAEQGEGSRQQRAGTTSFQGSTGRAAERRVAKIW
jgi:hypothetical protein